MLTTLRERTDNLFVVFGCGGDRDSAKRPVMGEIAARLCDRVFLTEDNSRSEEQGGIFNAVLAGVPAGARGRVRVIPDRRKAIACAAAASSAGGIIAILGKGHEVYLQRGNIRCYLSDFEQIQKY